MRIVPVADRLVRDPQTRRIVDEEGLTVDGNDPYWVRMLADGDVAPAPDPAKPGPSKENRA